MPRDYKNAGKKGTKPDNQSNLPATLLSLFTGLCVGLLIAFFVYAYYLYPWLQTQQERPEPAAPKAVKEAKPEPTTATPLPKFDFYRILPNREVNISEWVEDDEKGGTDELDALYVLQVGSFEKYTAADQTKARLALLGIAANIQRVVINGQDVRHRVRVGPYRNREELREVRKRLQDNGLDFMVLRLRLENLQHQ